MAANTVIGATIRVNADTKQAKQSMQDLQTQVNKLANKIVLKTDTAELKYGVKSAQDLKNALDAAVNVDTGKLNLSAFSSSLKKAKTNLSQLGNNLSSMGTEGKKAFQNLTNQIASASSSTIQMNKHFETLWTNLKKTASWQISSQIIHKFVGKLQEAVGYAKDLNNSLNKIQVVSGMSNDQMSQFAINAQKAASALSASTLAFTNAAKIYFQQGDDMTTAMQKATITMKAANVSFNSSAQEMSEYLTALWNSYQVGADELEHYVDVMANLGAHTASSMEEIMTAMQKVGATANNVGVSAEQMSTILATSASVTRQSAQTIGTSWNTILSRLGGLKLGETLEDGVDLNKYSKALQSVGISVLDANGDLREMGTIINEIGAQWGKMSKAQQSALAQTIGGARQYTQMMAFFDNFETYKINLDVAVNADGTLEKQQDKWAESAEAAAGRVKNAWQGLFSQTMDDSGIVKITNALADVIKGVTAVIDKMGGIVPIITLVASTFVAKLGANGQVSEGLKKLTENFKTFTGLGARHAAKLKQEAGDESARQAQKEDITDQERQQYAGNATYARAQAYMKRKHKNPQQLAELDKKKERYDAAVAEREKKRKEIEDAKQKVADAKASRQTEKASEDRTKNYENSNYIKNQARIAQEADAQRQASEAKYAQRTEDITNTYKQTSQENGWQQAENQDALDQATKDNQAIEELQAKKAEEIAKLQAELEQSKAKSEQYRTMTDVGGRLKEQDLFPQSQEEKDAFESAGQTVEEVGNMSKEGRERAGESMRRKGFQGLQEEAARQEALKAQLEQAQQEADTLAGAHEANDQVINEASDRLEQLKTEAEQLEANFNEKIQMLEQLAQQEGEKIDQDASQLDDSLKDVSVNEEGKTLADSEKDLNDALAEKLAAETAGGSEEALNNARDKMKAALSEIIAGCEQAIQEATEEISKLEREKNDLDSAADVISSMPEDQKGKGKNKFNPDEARKAIAMSQMGLDYGNKEDYEKNKEAIDKKQEELKQDKDFGNIKDRKGALEAIQRAKDKKDEQIDKQNEKKDKAADTADRHGGDGQKMIKDADALANVGDGEEELKRMDDAINDLDEDMARAAESPGKMSDAIASGFAGAMQAVAGVNMAMSGLEAAFDEGASATQRITGIMSALTGVTTALSGATQALNGIQNMSAIIKTKLGLASTKHAVSTVAESAANTAEAGTETVATAATVAHTLAKLGLAGAIIAAVAGVALLVAALIQSANQEQQNAKALAALRDEQDQLAASAQKLENKQKENVKNMQKLSSIAQDSTLSLQEQTDAINEITNAYGIQVSTLDVVSGRYGALQEQLNQAILAEQEQITMELNDISVKSQENVDKQIALQDSKNADFFSNFGNMVQKFFKRLPVFLIRAAAEILNVINKVFTFIINYIGSIPNIYKEIINGIIEMINGLLGWLGIHIGTITADWSLWHIEEIGFLRDASNSLLEYADAMEAAIEATEKATEKLSSSFAKMLEGMELSGNELNKWNDAMANNSDVLAAAGFTWNSATGTLGIDVTKDQNYGALYNLLQDNGLDKSGFGHELIGYLNNVGADIAAETEKKLQNAQLLTKMYSVQNDDGTNKLDMLNTQHRTRDLSDIQSMLDEVGANRTYQRQYLAEQLAGFSQWSEAAEQYQQIIDVSATVGKLKVNKDKGLTEEAIQDALLAAVFEGSVQTDNGQAVIDIDTLIRLHPSAIEILDDGNIKVESHALAMAQAQAAMSKNEEGRSTIESVSKIAKNDEIGYEDYKALQESGLFSSDEELLDFTKMDKASRELVLAQKKEESILDDIEQNRILVEEGTARAEILHEQVQEFYHNLNAPVDYESQYAGLSGEDLYNAMNTRLGVLNLVMSKMSEFKSKYSGKKVADLSDEEKNSILSEFRSTLTEEQQAAFIRDYGGKNAKTWSDLKLTDDMMINMFAQDAWQQSRDEVEDLNEAMAEGIELVGEYSSVTGEVRVAQQNINAGIYAKQAADLQKATKAADAYAKALGKQGKLKASELTELLTYDANAMTNYNHMSSEEWDKYVYEQGIKYYTELLSYYDADSAKYAEVMQAKKELTQSYYDDLKDKNTKVAESQEEEWQKQYDAITKAIDALSSIDINAEINDFSSLENLRQSLLEVGYTAEEVDNVIKNLGKRDNEGNEDALIAQMQAKLALLFNEQTMLTDKMHEAGEIYEVDANISNTAAPLWDEVAGRWRSVDQVTEFVTSGGEVYRIFVDTDGVTKCSRFNQTTLNWDTPSEVTTFTTVGGETWGYMVDTDGVPYKTKLDENGNWTTPQKTKWIEAGGEKFIYTMDDNGVVYKAKLDANGAWQFSKPYGVREIGGETFVYEMTEKGLVGHKLTANGEWDPLPPGSLGMREIGGEEYVMRVKEDGTTAIEGRIVEGKFVPAEENQFMITVGGEEYLMTVQPDGTAIASGKVVDGKFVKSKEDKKLVQVGGDYILLEVKEGQGVASRYNGTNWIPVSYAEGVTGDTTGAMILTVKGPEGNEAYLYKDGAWQKLNIAAGDLNNEASLVLGVDSSGVTHLYDPNTGVWAYTGPVIQIPGSLKVFESEGEYYSVDAEGNIVKLNADDAEDKALIDMYVEMRAKPGEDFEQLADGSWVLKKTIKGEVTLDSDTEDWIKEFEAVQEVIGSNYIFSDAQMLQYWDDSYWGTKKKDSINLTADQMRSRILNNGEGAQATWSDTYGWQTRKFSDYTGWISNLNKLGADKFKTYNMEQLIQSMRLLSTDISRIIGNGNLKNGIGDIEGMFDTISYVLLSLQKLNLTQQDFNDIWATGSTYNRVKGWKAFDALADAWTQELAKKYTAQGYTYTSEQQNALLSMLQLTKFRGATLSAGTNSPLVKNEDADAVKAAILKDKDAAGTGKYYSAEFRAYIEGTEKGKELLDKYQADFNTMWTKLNEEQRAMFLYWHTTAMEDSRWLIEGFIDGLDDNSDQLLSAMEELGLGSIEELKMVLGIGSPSKKTREMGKWLVKGLEEGLNKTEFKVDGFSNKVLKAISRELDKVDLDEVWKQYGITDDALGFKELSGFEGLDDYTFHEMINKNQLNDEQRNTILDWANSHWLEEGQAEYTLESFELLLKEHKEDLAKLSVAQQVASRQSQEDALFRQRGVRFIQAGTDEDSGEIKYVIEINGQVFDDEAYDTLDEARDAAIAAIYGEDQMKEWFSGGYQKSTALSAMQKQLMDAVVEETLKTLSNKNGATYATVEDYLSSSEADWDDFLNIANKKYTEKLTEYGSQLKKNWAEIKDTILQTYQQIDEAQEAQAQATYDRWKTTWEAIGKLRVAALTGETEGMYKTLSKDEQLAMLKNSGIDITNINGMFNYLLNPEQAKGIALMPLMSWADSGAQKIGARQDFEYDENGYLIQNAVNSKEAVHARRVERYKTNKASMMLDSSMKGVDQASSDLGLIYQYGANLSEEDFEEAYKAVNPSADATEIATAKESYYRGQDYIDAGVISVQTNEDTGLVEDMFYNGDSILTPTPEGQTRVSLNKNIINEVVEKLVSALDNKYEDTLYEIIVDEVEYLTNTLTNIENERKAIEDRLSAADELLKKAMDEEQRYSITESEWETLEKEYGPEIRTMSRSDLVEQRRQNAAARDANANKAKHDAARAEAEALARSNGYVQQEDGSWVKEDFVDMEIDTGSNVGGKQIVKKSLGTTTLSDAVMMEQFAPEVIETSEQQAVLMQETWSDVASSLGMSNVALEGYLNHILEINGSTKEWKDLTDSEKLSLLTVVKLSENISKAWEDLYNNQEENLKSLKKMQKETKGFTQMNAQATRDSYRLASGIAEDLKAIFGGAEEATVEFVMDHLDLVEKVMKGDKKAAEELEAELLKLQLGDDTYNQTINFDVNQDEVINELDTLGSLLNTFGDEYANEPINFELTADSSQAIGALNELLESGVLTADQITAALETIGWEPDIEYKLVGADGQTKTSTYGRVSQDGKTLTTISGEVITAGDSEMWVPVIKSVRKTGGGASSMPKKTKAGGGGGGGAKKVQQVKIASDEKERYHEITKQIDEQSKLLSRLDKLKSRTFGEDHLKAINKEIAALEKENKLYAQYAAEAEHNLEANRTILTQYGATFNEDGTVNYDEYMDKIVAEYNEAVEIFNASEQKTADNFALKIAEERYNQAKKALSNYEEDMQKVNETQENWLETQSKISAAMLEGIQYKVQIKFELNDREIKMMKYFRDKWEDLYYVQDKSLRYMIEEANDYKENLQTLGTELNELNNAYNNGTLTQADYTKGLQDVNDKILEQLNNLNTVKKSIKELYGNTLKKASDEIKKYTDILDHSRSIMESYIQLQALMGLGTDYSGLTKMYQLEYKSSLQSTKAAKEYLDTLKDSRAEIQNLVNKYGWTDTLKEQWEEVNDKIRSGESDLLSKTNQALSDAQTLFVNTMNAIVENFDNALFGMKNGLAKLEDDYAYYQEEQGRYLSTSKELYEVAKLSRQIDDSIADATTKTSKERLKALQAQIKLQSESTRLTEYDVQMLELQYQHALALQELEDAKNAKSVVRLTRDENGNFGYQYTADDNAISDAQQKVDDTLQQINELAANRVSEMEQAAVQAERQYRDSLLEIAQDTTLTLEERQAKMEELTRRYAETMQYNQEQYNNATSALLTNQQYVYERYGTSILTNTGMIQDQVSNAVAELMSNTTDYATFLQTQMAPGGAIYEALQQYKDNISIVGNTSGLNSWENMVASAEDFEKANEAATKELSKINDTLGETLTNIADVTDTWEQHASVIENVISKYEILGQTAAEAIKKMAGDLNGVESPNATNGIVTEEEIKNAKEQWMYTWFYDGFSGTWSGYDTREAAVAAAKSDVYQKFMARLEAGESDKETAENKAVLEAKIAEALKKIDIMKYRSGGLVDYTGPAWVDGSKSQPELMLNSTDTRNLLQVVDTVRSIDLAVLTELYNAINQNTMGMMYALGNITAPSGASNGTLDQNVHITAEFPNATDRTEIEEAFTDIINLAAQYANRK